MSKKKYMEILLEQIRNKKAKKLVEEEIGSHIDDQTAAYLREGYKEKDAERRAVLDMGDPVETGVSLDCIHRPRMSWGMIGLVGIISVIGLLVQYGICASSQGDLVTKGYFVRQLTVVILGFAAMLFICYVDYSVIGSAGELLAAAFVAAGAAALYFCRVRGIIFPSGLSLFLYLSVPLFGILLYQRRKSSRKRKIPAVVFWLFSVFLALQTYNVLIALNLLLLGALMLTFACVKGWIGKNRSVFPGTVWGIAAGIPLTVLCVSLRLSNGGFLADYQSERLRMMLSGNYLIPPYGFQSSAEVLSGIRMIGGSSAAADGMAAELASDYALLHAGAAYGLLPLIVILCLFTFFCVQMFRMAMGQKNQLGMAMGFGCCLVLCSQTVEYLLMNFGLFATGQIFLPFFSYGRGSILLSSILLGILLSVHRYQNLATEQTADRRRIRVKISVE